ncbi:hypothetical protein Barb4_03354 [Bacteroidales bacterium Barb4]|nr:hypothetical protein Barb4_03354 [Bacteroidales bacterium Barb4]
MFFVFSASSYSLFIQATPSIKPVTIAIGHATDHKEVRATFMPVSEARIWIPAFPIAEAEANACALSFAATALAEAIRSFAPILAIAVFWASIFSAIATCAAPVVCASLI